MAVTILIRWPSGLGSSVVAASIPAPDSAAARVLVVGDASADRDALGRHVQADGHVVDTAGNSGEAFAKLRTGRFDLVLLDVRRPEMDGPQFLQALRSEAALAHLPVVVVSPADDVRRRVIAARSSDQTHRGRGHRT